MNGWGRVEPRVVQGRGLTRLGALLGIALLATLGGCGPSTPTPPRLGERYEGPAVRVAFGQVHQGAPETEGAAQIFAAFDPVQLRGTWTQSGELSSAEWSPLDLHPLASMRFCINHRAPCEPVGDWQPFELVVERSIAVSPAERAQLWLGATFRDGEGNVVPAFIEPSSPQQVVSVSLELKGED